MFYHVESVCLYRVAYSWPLPVCATWHHTQNQKYIMYYMHSVLWRCWLGARKKIRPVKTEWWGAGVVICLEQGADLHMVQLMPLPLTVTCFSKIQIGFTFLVPAHLGSPGKRAVKRVCVYYNAARRLSHPQSLYCYYAPRTTWINRYQKGKTSLDLNDARDDGVLGW